MTPRSLFNIILKIIGLFFVRDSILEMFQFISQLLYFINSGTPLDGIGLIIAVLLFTSFYSLVGYQLLFKSNWIIDKLKLDQGFAEHEFSFTISPSLVLTIGLVVIAGIILINEVPNFCRQFYKYFDERKYSADVQKPDLSFMIIAGTKIVIALLLVGERKAIVELIEKRSSEKKDES